jgi:hypothetical protein
MIFSTSKEILVLRITVVHIDSFGILADFYSSVSISGISSLFEAVGLP